MANDAGAEPVALPDGSRLIHIGPPKTGTSELQMAFHLKREELRTLGVHYPGKTPQPGMAARFISGMPGPPGSKQPTVKPWNKLVNEVSESDARIVVISSEFFATCPDDAAARVVEAMGGPRAHIVITLRPLASILPSAWQQYVRHGLRMKYQRWLQLMLSEDPERIPTPSFWRLHRDDQLIARWTQAAGADNVHVIVPTEQTLDLRLRAFEALVGLPEGTLQSVPDARNRALTAVEAAYLRLLNQRLHEHDIPPAMRRHIVVKSVVPALLTMRPDPDDPPIVTPDESADQVAEIGAAVADGIRELGVHVIGDLSALSARSAATGVPETMRLLPAVVAATATAEAIQSVVDYLAATSEPQPEAEDEE